jgi:hypothetical protein
VKKKLCCVEACPRVAFAKGYCRRHYAQMWRKGCIYDTTPKFKLENDRVAIERSLAEERKLYDLVCTFSSRLYHRARIVQLEEQLKGVSSHG